MITDKHYFESVGRDFPNTCRLCACFLDSANHYGSDFRKEIKELRSIAGSLQKQIDQILDAAQVLEDIMLQDETQNA